MEEHSIIQIKCYYKINKVIMLKKMMLYLCCRFLNLFKLVYSLQNIFKA